MRSINPRFTYLLTYLLTLYLAYWKPEMTAVWGFLTV